MKEKKEFEFERKFLLKRPMDLEPESVIQIYQGYINNGQGAPYRIRMQVEDGADRYYKVQKTTTGIPGVVEEHTRDMSRDEWLELLPQCGRGLDKVRRVYTIGDHRWEEDRYTDLTLITLELELLSEDAVDGTYTQLMSIPVPEEICPFVIKEVTGDTSFSNYMLAYRDWSTRTKSDLTPYTNRQ